MRLDASRDELVDENVSDVVAGLGDDSALGVDGVSGERTGEHRVLDVRVARPGLPSASCAAIGEVETLGRAAVVFADDDVLRDVDETTREVTRVGGTEGRVGQTLAGTVRRDEVLGDRQSLAVARDDRARDDLTLRVVHQASHTGDVAHLQPVTTSTGRHHAVDGVVLREVGAHGLGDLFGGLGPDLDELLATLGVGGETLLELRPAPWRPASRSPHDLALVRRGQDVGERDGDTGTGRPVEAGVLDAVERCSDLDLGVPLGEVVDDRRELALVGDVLDVRVVGRQRLVEERATERGLDECRLAVD